VALPSALQSAVALSHHGSPEVGPTSSDLHPDLTARRAADGRPSGREYIQLSALLRGKRLQ
jgi:hypothetical protein